MQRERNKVWRSGYEKVKRAPISKKVLAKETVHSSRELLYRLILWNEKARLSSLLGVSKKLFVSRCACMYVCTCASSARNIYPCSGNPDLYVACACTCRLCDFIRDTASRVKKKKGEHVSGRVFRPLNRHLKAPNGACRDRNVTFHDDAYPSSLLSNACKRK